MIDFFEHVYLHCYHKQWVQWARQVWGDHWSRTGRPAQSNPFEQIVSAFLDGNYTALDGFAADVVAIKRVLRTAKDDEYRLRIERARRDLLAYPIA